MPGAASLLRHLDADARDADLLAAVVAGDEMAFASLVRRHGSMVLGVCRRVSGNEADAEDAFQATFLVLMRKASRIRSPALLGNYLYGVAVRTSRAARRRRLRRREVFAVPDVPARSSPDAELAAVIDDGLAKLPAHYRDAILLCDLHELSRSEAASRLDIPEGTLSSRLAKGRAKLADILTRRGVTLSVAAVSAVVAVPATAVPGRLLESTLAAVGGAAYPTAILELTHEGTWPMRTKLATLATAGLLTAAGWVAVSGGEPPKAAEPAKPGVTVAEPNPVIRYGSPRMQNRLELPVDKLAWAPDGKTIYTTHAGTGEGGVPLLVVTHTNVSADFGSRASLNRQFVNTPGVWYSFVGPASDGKLIAVRKEETGINGMNAFELYPNPPASRPASSQPTLAVPLDDTVWGWHFLSPDVKFLLASVRPVPPPIKPGKTAFRVFTIPSGDAVRTVFETDEWVWRAAVSKDFTRLATLSGADGQDGRTARVFELTTGMKLWEAELDFIGVAEPAKATNNPFAGSNRPTLKEPPEPPRRELIFTPDGQRLAVVNSTTGVRVLDATTGKKLPKWDDAMDPMTGGSYSFDGRLFAGVGGKTNPDGYNFLRVWDTTTGKLVKEWKRTTQVTALFAPDRPTLAIAEDVANGKGLVRIGFWDFPAVR